jgi:dTDP-glucose pyrophosphorylase
MWGIVPAAGQGKRMQPLAFSKELLPVGFDQVNERKEPRAVSDFVVERLIIGGAKKICFVISPNKVDIVRYHGCSRGGSLFVYVIQPDPVGLCDAIFRPMEIIPPGEQILIGLPDTVWFPANALRSLPENRLSFLLFPVAKPEHFDAVVLAANEEVQRIEVKQQKPSTNWIWGAIKMNTAIYRDLHELWIARNRSDEFLGTLINAWIANGGHAYGAPAGNLYMDVGTIEGLHVAFAQLMKGYSASGTSS